MITPLLLDMNSSPFEQTFGRPPSLGLKSSKLLDAIYEKAHSEEELMEYLQDAELIRLTVFCQQTPMQEKRPVQIPQRQCYDDGMGFSTSYSPISTNGTVASTSATLNQMGCGQDVLQNIIHASTPSNTSFYTHTGPNTPLPPQQSNQQQPPQQQHQQDPYQQHQQQQQHSQQPQQYVERSNVEMYQQNNQNEMKPETTIIVSQQITECISTIQPNMNCQ